MQVVMPLCSNACEGLRTLKRSSTEVMQMQAKQAMATAAVAAVGKEAAAAVLKSL